MEFLIAWLIIGGLTAMNAKRKGRNPMGWFLIGFLFGPLGLIISFLVRDNTEALEAASIEAGESKRCPHCAETVKAEAVKCRHCGEAVKLDELLAVNASLTTVYLLKDQIKTLWFADDEAAARGAWQEWAGMALGSGIDALVRFTRKLEPYLEGIVSSAQHRLNTSVLEGMNNRIKVIKRMAYGYRDTAYFFLKIRAAFPGKVR